MVKISQLELENVKRIRAVQFAPSANGLTIIGGKNNQGKSSVLDAIAWALGGEKFRPSQAQREGSVLPPKLKVTLSNGLVVTRDGKNGALKVTDETRRKGGQQILNEFVEALALDLPKFMNASERDKAEILLNVIGVGPQLAKLDLQAKELYNQRLAVGRVADQKKKFAQEMPDFPDMPDQPIPAEELVMRHQAVLAQNAENQAKRDRAAQLREKEMLLNTAYHRLTEEVARKREELEEVRQDLEIAAREAENLEDRSTELLEQSIRELDELNRKIRANLDKDKALEDAQTYAKEYDDLTRALESVRTQRTTLLDGAALPLPGLSVEDGALTYHGMHWDSLSGSDQLKVAAAIVRAINPKCGFVLMDKLEQMDLDTLSEFGAWLEEEGLQVIATRVSTGEECHIIIEDGETAERPTAPVIAPPPAWTPRKE